MFQNEPYTKSKLDIKSGHNVITKIKIHTKHIKVYLLWEFKITKNLNSQNSLYYHKIVKNLPLLLKNKFTVGKLKLITLFRRICLGIFIYGEFELLGNGALFYGILLELVYILWYKNQSNSKLGFGALETRLE